MLLSRLPDPGLIKNPDVPPSFGDHVFFSEQLNHAYKYPEHRCSFGLVSMFSGNGTFVVNKRPAKIDRASFLVVNNNSAFSISITDDSSNPGILYFKSFLPEMIAQSLGSVPEELLENHDTDARIDFSIMERLHSKQEGMKRKLQMLLEIGHSSSSFAALKADILVRSLLEELFVSNHKANEASMQLNVAKKSTRIELCRRLYVAKEWMEANYHRPISIEDIAKVVAMNSQHFLRMFKQLFSVTPHQYLTGLRLQEAKRLLEYSCEPVGIICHKTGFESISSFSWLFKQHFGKSPLAYRKGSH